MPEPFDRLPHAPPPSRSPSRSARLAELHADIARRLRPLCGSMPETEFEALVREMAERQLKYEVRPGS
ncbi:MAG: hypothetical protein ACXW0Z_00205 [Gemmatirosa sp.]